MGDLLHARGVLGGLARRAVIAGILASGAASCVGARGGGTPPPPRRIVYDDLNRHIAAVARINSGAAPEAEMQAYLDGAGEGLRTWLSIYPATAAELTAEYAGRPRYYASLSTMPQRLAPLEREIAQSYANMEALVPGADLGAVYFLIGKRNAGGTARQLGTMVAIEFFGRTDQTDLSEFPANPTLFELNELVQVVVHEGAHNLQRHLQGEQNYISIYMNPQRMTLVNFAVREGVADYLAYLIAERRMEAKHVFADPREAEIWAEFQPIMHENIMAKPGWFTGRFADGRIWPNQMGYYVGYKIAEYYHASARDRRAALLELLAPNTDEQFNAIAQRYAEKFA